MARLKVTLRAQLRWTPSFGEMGRESPGAALTKGAVSQERLDITSQPKTVNNTEDTTSPCSVLRLLRIEENIH